MAIVGQPRPVLLLADTAYRIAASHLNRAKGQHAAVLAQLGSRAEDVPIFDAFEFEALMLRCDALERTGQQDAALEVMTSYLRADAGALWKVDSTKRADGRTRLCPLTSDRAHQIVCDEVERKLRLNPSLV